MKVAVLGAGLVGGAIARTLAESGWSVRSVEYDSSRLDSLKKFGIEGLQADANNESELGNALEGYAFVVNALPGSIGFQALKTCVELGKSVSDISFCPEDMRELDSLAKESGSSVIADFGFAPGLSNLFVADACRSLSVVERVTIYVGGLPIERTPPYEYKAVFSPADVIEEYTRPARFKVNGEFVEKEPLTDIEAIEFPEYGLFEAFNTDGLRSLLSIPVPTLIEKTIRYPGYADKILLLKDTGLLNTNPMEVAGVKVSPKELTCALLFDLWKYEQGDDDVSLLRVIASGQLDGANTSIQYDLIDRFDPKKKLSSMARTTGFTACAGLHMLKEGIWKNPGVIAPEELPSDAFCYVESFLKPLGVNWTKKVS